MALTTRCPQCGTSFKVVPDQLRVRNGLVRCGACSTVFDGRACLLPESGAPATPPAVPAMPPVVPPPLSRPSAEPPRQIAPWEDEPIPAPTPPPPAPVPAPVTPVAPVAPTVPPAVLRGREAIRRHTEPDEDLPENEVDDDGEDDSDLHDSARHAAFARHPEPVHEPAPRWAPSAQPASRNEPVIASRATEPVIDWDARRRGAAPAEPSFAARDDEDDRDREDEHPEAPSGGHRDDFDDHDDRGDARPRDFRIRDDGDDDDELDDETREPVLGDTRTRYSSATDVGRAPPEFLDQDRQERRGLLRKVWGYACLVGLIALGLQMVYAYRTDIANSVPALRPVLDVACKPLGCAVGYARRLERIAISSSSLQPPPGAAAIDDGRSRLVLNLVLRNRYDKPQHWPALVLDLTDLSDTVVVRKVLMPENYLTPEQLSGPFGPAGELKISVPIEVTGVQVNGYQLDKFFP
ncbi:DUF3426 domain-containing protein [Achromobacter sp. Bel]|uniref:DUF3426 domain-containing protein n=1 Tax=Achromobacter sp. Bel TaxID=2727415 RepID=UPI00145CAC57|nr:DUF3426 domain-containing protein [Achromobacter sp. Bel]NMK47646.1 DUF3426 domain-containing protein [Achromobacter sp. Bel]